MKLDPKYNKKPDDPGFLDMEITPLTEEQATYHLREGWYKLYESYPSNNTLAILWAQTALETGRWSMLRNNNWGNIKRRSSIQYWTSYEAGEYLNKGDGLKHYMFYPYHPQTHFSAWKTASDGAKGYIEFLLSKKRYEKAAVELIAGDPVTYCAELRKGGYFTAPLDHYTSIVVKLFKEFHSKSERLLAWKPEEIKPEPVLESTPEPKPEPEPEPEPEEEEPKLKEEEPKEDKPELRADPKPKNLFELIISLLKSIFRI